MGVPWPMLKAFLGGKVKNAFHIHLRDEEIIAALNDAREVQLAQHAKQKEAFAKAKEEGKVEEFYQSHFYGDRTMEQILGNASRYGSMIIRSKATSIEDWEAFLETRAAENPELEKAMEETRAAESAYAAFLAEEVDPALNARLITEPPQSVPVHSLQLINAGSGKKEALAESLKAPATMLIMLRFFG